MYRTHYYPPAPAISGRFLTVLLMLSIHCCSHAQDSSLAHPVSITGNVQVTNNGTAPAPIFALGRPAIIGTAIIRKNRFFFNSDLYFGLDAKPWTVNSRFGYFIADNEKWSVNLASNLSLFFLQRNPVLNNKEEFQLQRYWGNELNAEHRISPNRKLFFQYWHTIALDDLAIRREEFINLVFMIEQLHLGKKSRLSIRPSAFYLFDKNYIEGVFISQTTLYQRSSWKINLFAQTTLPLYTVPANRFIWNAGFNLPF